MILDEIIEVMIVAYDAEMMRCEDCASCKGTGVIRISNDPEHCSCGGGQIFPGTDESCMRAAFKALQDCMPQNKGVEKLYSQSADAVVLWAELKNLGR